MESRPFSVPIDHDLTHSSPESLNNCQLESNCFQDLSFFDDLLRHSHDLDNNFEDFPCDLSNALVSILTSDINKK
eukprot:Awhi_evm1s12832